MIILLKHKCLSNSKAQTHHKKLNLCSNIWNEAPLPTDLGLFQPLHGLKLPRYPRWLSTIFSLWSLRFLNRCLRNRDVHQLTLELYPNQSLEGNAIPKVVLVFYFLKVLRIVFLAYNWEKLLTQSDSVWECGRTGPRLCTHSWGRMTQKTPQWSFWATQNSMGPHWLPLSLIVRLTAAAQQGWKASSQTSPNAGSYNAKRPYGSHWMHATLHHPQVNSSKPTWNSQSSWLILSPARMGYRHVALSELAFIDIKNKIQGVGNPGQLRC